ncbi:MAG: hypothetical protein KC933_10560 [Myxococcales bacterium]|nr:hypothetical protein [Myxococcales bacterium]
MSEGQQRLGALLVEMGFVDPDELSEALVAQRTSDKRLGKILIERGVITEDRLVHALSRQLGIEACDPIMTPVHPAVLAMVPAEVAFKHRVLPVARQREGSREVLYVATSDPLDQDAAGALRRALPQTTHLRWMLAGETEMDLALARHYGAPSESRRAAPAVPAGMTVITGVPVAAPPRRPSAESLGALTSLSTTDDIFVALQEAVEGAPVPEPPPSRPELRVVEATWLGRHTPEPVSALAPQGSAPSGPATREDEPSDLPFPSEVPEELPEVEVELEEDGPESLISDDLVPSPDPAPAALPKPPARAPSLLPTSDVLSQGPSWGDLLGGSEEGNDALLGVLAEAAAMPEGTPSLPIRSADLPVMEDDDEDDDSPISLLHEPEPLDPEHIFSLETPVEFERSVEPPGEGLEATPAWADTPVWHEPPPELPVPSPLEREPEEAEDAPGEITEVDFLELEHAHARRLQEARAAAAPMSWPAPEGESMDLDAESVDLGSGSLDLSSRSVDLGTGSADLPNRSVDLGSLPLDPDALPQGAAPHTPAAPAPSEESALEGARLLLGRFAAGEALPEAQVQWILRFLASVALHADLLANEAALRFVGPPPE